MYHLNIKYVNALSVPSPIIFSESEKGSEEISASIFFFHSKARKFFGNTMHHVISRRSGGMGCKAPCDTGNGIDINRSLFWYSNVSGSGNYIVVEFQCTTSNGSKVDSCGFALIPLVNDDQTSWKLSVFEGTTRKLLYLPLGMITYDSIDAYLPKMNSKLYVTVTKTISQTDLSKFIIENKIFSVDENLSGLNLKIESNGNLCVKFSNDKRCFITLDQVWLSWSQRIEYENTLLDAIDREYCGESETLNKCRKSSFLGNMRQKRLSLSSKSKIECRYLRIIAHNTDSPLFITSAELVIRNDELVPSVENIQLPYFSGTDVAYVFSLEYKIVLPKGKCSLGEHMDFHIAGQIDTLCSWDDNSERQKSISLVQNRQIYSIFDRNNKFPFESTYLGGTIGSLCLEFNLTSCKMNGESTELKMKESLGECVVECNENAPDSVPNSIDRTPGLKPSRIDIDMDCQNAVSSSSHLLKSCGFHREGGKEEQTDTSHNISYGQLLVDTVPDLKNIIHDMQMYMRSGELRWLDSASSIFPRDKCLSFFSQMETYDGRFQNEMLETHG